MSLRLTDDVKCKKNSFFCTSSKNCINIISLCDGIFDCPSGEDEENCQTNTLFACNKTHSISYQHVCNYMKDCENNLDEVNCSRYFFSPKTMIRLIENFRQMFTEHEKCNDGFRYE